MSAQRTFLLAALITAAACGAPGSHGHGDGGIATLTVSPPTLSVEVVNGVAQTQAYTATMTNDDGSTTDVTQQVTFIVEDGTIGYFDHATLTVPGAGAGVTKIHATMDGATGTADLKVLVKDRRVDPAAPPNAPDLFGAASTDPNKQLAVAYPPQDVIVPQNLGDFEVHWRDSSGDNLYEVTMRNDFVDLRFYVVGGAEAWGSYLPAEWSTAAHNAKDLEVIVRGLNTSAPQTAATSTVTKVHLTNDEIQGGIYYWAAATTNGAPEGIWRHDMSKPGDPPQQFFTTAETPNGRCVACHALSRDGTKMAVTYNGGDGSATVLDVATRAAAIPPDTDYWNFATFNPTGSKLLTVHQGQLSLRDAASGALLATVPNTGVASHPDFSPKGDQFVYVQRGAGADWSFQSGALYTVSYDDSTQAFGTPAPLVPSGGANNYYPSYSPDGKWILYNRTDDNSNAYNSGNAELWVVRSDGSQPPLKLSAADIGPGLTNSWARWAPFQSTYGASDEPLYWITFSSKREFGVRLTAALGNTRPQIWMTPFFPDRMTQSQDPTSPSFRLPFQSIDTSNHIAQWTERVVPVN
ncbi:MAG TPA: hypothetical protein VL463_35500 [Kofleriaceae bacterium]|jgi:hypothetical protein|nr:hypothetical protein [Kofleriaceae bacterium]